jgi:hypothetical protein
MVVMIPCKKIIQAKYAPQMFFERVLVHFFLPLSIIFDYDNIFLNQFWQGLWGLMDI